MSASVPLVPPSHALAMGQWDKLTPNGTTLGTERGTSPRQAKVRLAFEWDSRWDAPWDKAQNLVPRTVIEAAPRGTRIRVRR